MIKIAYLVQKHYLEWTFLKPLIQLALGELNFILTTFKIHICYIANSQK